MTNAEMMKMRIDGATYQEIADACGITRQDAHQRVQNYCKRIINGGHRGRQFDYNGIVYQGIYEYFNNNTDESLSSFCNKIYGNTAQVGKLGSFFKGEIKSHFTIQQINKICEIVGKSFEETFAERKPIKMIEKEV